MIFFIEGKSVFVLNQKKAFRIFESKKFLCKYFWHLMGISKKKKN